MHKLILMIEEKTSMTPITMKNCKEKTTLPSNLGKSTSKRSFQCLPSNNKSQLDLPVFASNESRRSIKAPCSTRGNKSLKNFPSLRETSMSTYNDLHDRLKQITLEIKAKGHEVGCPFELLENGKTNMLNVAKRFLKNIKENTVLSNMKKYKILIDNQAVNLNKTLLKSKNKSSSKKLLQFTKENIKPNEDDSKLLSDHQKHLARKYLGELYTRIIYKVKDFEKERRLKLFSNKKTLEERINSTRDLYKKNIIKPFLGTKKQKNSIIILRK